VTSAPTGASAERTGPRDLPGARALLRIERGRARASHRFLQTAGAGSGGRLAREGERFEHTSWGLINVRDGLWGFDSATGCCRSAERGGRGAWTTIFDRPGNTRKSCPLPERRKGKKHAMPEQQPHHVPTKDGVEQKRLHHHSSVRITTRRQRSARMACVPHIACLGWQRPSCIPFPCKQAGFAKLPPISRNSGHAAGTECSP